MSRTFHHGKNRDRQIRVQGVRRQPADLRKLARALIELARAEAERAAAADHEATADKPTTAPNNNDAAERQTTSRPRKRAA